MSQSLPLLIEAGFPLILIETQDEAFASNLVVQAAKALARPLFDWSITAGLTAQGAPRPSPVVPAGKAVPALEHVCRAGGNGIFLFRDLAPHMKDPQVERYLRDLYVGGGRHGPVIVLLEATSIGDHLRDLTVPYEIKPPDLAELVQIVKGTFTRLHRDALYEVTSNVTERQLDELVRSLSGLSRCEASRVIASAVVDDHVLDASDLPRIVEAKRALLGARGVLETILVDFTTDDVGGLDGLKRWLKKRRDAHSRKAREFGLDPPRGLLLLGVQGCGKSLSAKAVAADWKLPLLRLDPGVLYQKFVGESERTLRDALSQAEAMAPVVLWVDEIEKAFASSHSASADGGLSQRMFGTFLSWLQDHRHSIFTVATANDVSALPPELLRKGRFDEVFFVDLPNAPTREKILAVHLTRRRRDPAQFDLPRVAAATEGFSGAELEQLVVAALYDSFAARHELTTDDLIQAVGATRPLSVLMHERIVELREWARDRCTPAD